jgi:hypothetical protein
VRRRWKSVASIRHPDDGVDERGAGTGRRILFHAVPEPKTVKNRVHWDVLGEVADFEAAGATVLDVRPRWTVMADIEGNEFCVFPPR